MASENIAIKVENISKLYRIGVKDKIHDSLGRAIFEYIKSPLNNYRKYRSLYRFDDVKLDNDYKRTDNSDDIIWALKNISFKVKQGEVLGLIGGNGAGKSTLLKILSRITDPTYGRAEIRGKVASLLEVGTGFHPELTGRENVYLNGTVLGMTKKEVEQKFDEIVDFSGVKKFIDTPVKRYSSGMTVRLAFSVAAHLEPEILLIDEVLAVGDLAFQRKCLGKMEEVAKGGRTILFVSHNMGAIQNLCTSCLWLDEGNLRISGEVGPVVGAYYKSQQGTTKTNLANMQRKGNAEACITSVRLLDIERNSCNIFSMGETIIVEFDLDCYRFFRDLDITLEVIRTDMNINVLHLKNQDCGKSFENISPGKHAFRIEIPNCMLYPNLYKISIWVGTNMEKTQVDSVKKIIDFSMIQSDVTQRTQSLSIHKEAIFFTPSKWEAI